MMRAAFIVVALLVLGSSDAASSSSTPANTASTCGDFKSLYRASTCCGSPTKVTNFSIVPKPSTSNFLAAPNPCAGAKPKDNVQNNPLGVPGTGYFNNVECMINGTIMSVEQAGANVTLGYRGGMNTGSRQPITTSYMEAGLCPVNVHWHLGTEHLSVGQYDELGTGPNETAYQDNAASSRRAAARLGFRCHHYDANDSRFTTPYAWKHCDSTMKVGETYEVHWPHSAAGACGTPDQYQSPFYDGVFCRPGIISASATNLNTFQKIGVQAQIFTIINDDAYYYPDLMRGMIIQGVHGMNITKYTGSTTGTSRDNTICSRYTPISWQVDRVCHLISASSFDKMCADMKQNKDDMSSDIYAHGSRILVADFLAANNQQRRSYFPEADTQVFEYLKEDQEE